MALIRTFYLLKVGIYFSIKSFSIWESSFPRILVFYYSNLLISLSNAFNFIFNNSHKKMNIKSVSPRDIKENHSIKVADKHHILFSKSFIIIYYLQFIRK